MNVIYEALMSGLESAWEYLSQHVVTCLIPALFIAGAIAAFVKKDAILRYLGPGVRRRVSYTVASVSGAVLAVCSCTVLPLFAGIYKKGSGIGPATTFLYAGPAINILAVAYTASALGMDLGAARAISAVLLSVLLGLAMSALFGKGERDRGDASSSGASREVGGEHRPLWVSLAFFVCLVGILLTAASRLPIEIKFGVVYLLTLFVAYILIYHYRRDEVTAWGYETFDLAKKILPLLLIGTFVVGVIAHLVPPETFRPYFGDNSVGAVFLASIVGAILYMPTLLEVPIVGTTFGYTAGVMAPGPALALLLAGPSISLPNIIALTRIMGLKRTAVYVLLVVHLSTLAGVIYGNIAGR